MITCAKFYSLQLLYWCQSDLTDSIFLWIRLHNATSCKFKFSQTENDPYRYLSVNIKPRRPGRSFHENWLALILLFLKIWKKSRKSQFFRTRHQIDLFTSESFLYFDIIFFIYRIMDILTKILLAWHMIHNFLILLKAFLNNWKMWKSSTDFDLPPESAIMVQMSSDQGKWYLRSLNNFFIHMSYP